MRLYDKIIRSNRKAPFSSGEIAAFRDFFFRKRDITGLIVFGDYLIKFKEHMYIFISVQKVKNMKDIVLRSRKDFQIDGVHDISKTL